MRIDKQELLKQLQEWSDNGEYAKIVSAARLFPKNELGDEILTILADAYIEEKEFKKAIVLLEEQRSHLDGDYHWHFRLGMALYCYSLGEECENDDELHADILERAQVSFARCMNLTPPEKVLEEAGNFMDRIEDAYNELCDDDDIDCSDCEMYDEEELDAIEEHIEEYFGDFPTIFHEIKSPDIHCDIYIIPPTEKRDYYTLITVGMGAHVMELPEELDSDEHGRAELMICLPKDWKIGDNAEKWFWPISLLKNLARLPINCDTWLGWGHSVDNREPFAENTKFCSSLLIYPEDVESGADSCLLPNGESVNFFELIPLYREEMQFKIDNDTHALLEKMNGISHILDINRANCCEGYKKRGLIDCAEDDSKKIDEKNLPLDRINGCNHLAVFLRWCIEHDLYNRSFFEPFPDIIEDVKSGKPIDLRNFILQNMNGELISTHFSYLGFMFVRRYYDFNNPFPDFFYPRNVDDYAEEYFGTEKYNSEEFQDEAYLFVPFDEDYYKNLSKYIDRAYEVFYPEYLEYNYNDQLPLIKRAEEFFGCECIFPKDQRDIIKELKKALNDCENEDWFPLLLVLGDISENVDDEIQAVSRIYYNSIEPFFSAVAIARTPRKFFDRLGKYNPIDISAEEIISSAEYAKNAFGEIPAAFVITKDGSKLLIPQGNGEFLLLRGE